MKAGDMQQLETIKGEVTRVRRFENGYTILTLKTKKTTTTLVGDMPAFAEGTNIVATAQKTTHPKYGDQYKVVEIQETGFSSREGLVNYLSSDHFHGVGKTYAGKIVKHLGLEALQKLDEDPDRIFEVSDLPEAVAQSFRECWDTAREEHRVIGALMKMGLTGTIANKARALFGADAPKIIQGNPYELVRVEGVGFLKADAIALGMGAKRDSPRRVEAATLYAMEQALLSGDCFLPLPDLGDKVTDLLGDSIDRMFVLEAIRSLVAKGLLVNQQHRVYLSHIHTAEKEVAKRLKEMLDEPCPPLYPSLESLRSQMTSIGITEEITLAPRQEEALLNALNSRVAVITGGPGTGKALANDTLIPTPDGLRPIADLKEGDRVIGSDGKLVRVRGVYPQGVKPLYRVTFNDRTSVECCEEHLWSVQTKRDRLLSRRRVMSTRDIIERIKEHGAYARLYIPYVGAVEFEQQKLSLDPYLLGVVIGDGGLTQGTVHLSNSSDHVLSRVRAVLNDEAALKQTCREGRYTLVKNCPGRYNPIITALSDLGLMGLGSYDKHIPEEYLFSSIKDRTRLLHGLMDTDGTCDKECSSFSTVSATLARQVQFLAQSLGCKAVLSRKNGTYNKEPHSSWRVTIAPPPGLKLFSLPRKAERQIDRTKYAPIRAIRSVEYSRDAECVCIEVDAEDSLYCANDFIVTHNTTVTRALCQLLDHHHFDFKLCSPTGRAAKRLAEATGREAQTIHRMLEFSSKSGGFLYDQSNPLPARVVIIDEASMVDIRLFRDVLNAMDRQKRLVIIGDKDQLPSVGPGNVLRDLIASGVVPCVKLDQIFRQVKGNTIITVAHDILHGNTPDLPTPAESKGRNAMIVIAEEQETLIAHILTLITKSLPQIGYKPEDIQVLTPMRAKGLGVQDLNPRLQAVLNPPDPLLKAEVSLGLRILRVGDRVMQIKNNYNKGPNGVFNGDLGYISAIIRSGDKVTVWVRYPDMDDVVEYEQDELEEIVHAFACTVHKSQGAEYPVVILVQHTSQYNMLQRNLIYTGVTRARKICILAGTRRAVEVAVNNDKMIQRNTTLAELIAKSV